MARGDFATAENEAQAAAGSRNPQPSAVLVMAEVKLKAGKPAEALQVVEQAQAFAKDLRLPSVYNLEYLRGDALARLNRVAGSRDRRSRRRSRRSRPTRRRTPTWP